MIQVNIFYNHSICSTFIHFVFLCSILQKNLLKRWLLLPVTLAQIKLSRWSGDDSVLLLRMGHNDHTTVFGGMTEMIQHSLQHLSAEDATAIARYLKSLGARDPNQAGFTQDDTVADVVNFIQSSWGNRAKAQVSGSDVAKARKNVAVEQGNADIEKLIEVE